MKCANCGTVIPGAGRCARCGWQERLSGTRVLELHGPLPETKEQAERSERMQRLIIEKFIRPRILKMLDSLTPPQGREAHASREDDREANGRSSDA